MGRRKINKPRRERPTPFTPGDDRTEAAYRAFDRLMRAQEAYGFVGEPGREVEVGLEELEAAFDAAEADIDDAGFRRGDVLGLWIQRRRNPCG